ncbi:DUF523 domain-containing protein [Anaerosalibacter bizertensis]|uniref:DUF523 domain-containing protein n=1 Tax=Anaerosalibacter bizertensis TaxID=932217 RepID=A0A844FGK0_9FIRM|nr:DUF523 domain-containing protein [Anaerosalibacter bizertensis]MBV1818286.1 DUF523 domain-containing protein [Bacteroidales bacterium MSK.15.36]HHV26115.1 DUF523 domain-containing protein [Tissierellia bacterium]MBU5292588.1 DUF523 domain-containing protein [Anaerosalibacter bizertensis]MCB5558996.1 DUF523 domain-containing protein [Anaerosalibacter bizertensis]MCG4564913.1 DUF523 domain-containing protein [Anaerosalibacter bizertensis]
MYIVSACLAGIKCRYDGKDNENNDIIKLVKEGKAIPVCPEVLGGLPIPRVPCEIIEDKSGKLKVINKEGKDCTLEFLQGAQKALAIAEVVGADTAILKSKSPSCGCGKIYDGKFNGNLVDGDGITTRLFKENGIKVYTENNFTLD